MDAGIDALHIDARMIARAVAVAVAADHAAAIQGIAMIALAAAAVGHVVVREALSIGTARIRNQARIYAVVILAGLIKRALAVVSAFDGVAGNLGIALVALLARADWFVIPHIASGVGTAVAGITTLSVDARLAVTAIVVRRARSNDRQLYYKIEIIYGLFSYIYIVSKLADLNSIKLCLLGLHTPSTSVIQPSGHVQIIVLTGTVSRTSQRAFSKHGLMTGQGSMHCSRMHTNLSKQSMSTLHSGSSISSTECRSQ